MQQVHLFAISEEFNTKCRNVLYVKTSVTVRKILPQSMLIILSPSSHLNKNIC